MTVDRIRTRARWVVAVTTATTLGLFGLGFLTSPAHAAATVTREAGNDRFETAAKLSHDTFSSGVQLVFITTGQAFPDALAGAPAAAKAGGPILLVDSSDNIPTPTQTELTRLSPANIVVLGGTGAVSDAVVTKLKPFTKNGTGSVTRIAGNDRYETAADVGANSFPSAKVAYVATGADFPDALSGGPGVFNDIESSLKDGPGPILLVQQNQIPTATANVLSALKTAGLNKIVVLGGTGSVSNQVQTNLGAYAGNVGRISGPDRYSTSVFISQNSFPGGAKTVYLATGMTFPDALAGGPVAAIAPGPVLLVQTNCIPQGTKDEIARLKPDTIVLLGGTSALGSGVENQTACSTGTTLPGGSTIPTDFCTSLPQLCNIE